MFVLFVQDPVHCAGIRVDLLAQPSLLQLQQLLRLLQHCQVINYLQCAA